MRAGTRMLLVEDDPSIVDFVEPELQRVGFHARCAHDGLSGLDETRLFGPSSEQRYWSKVRLREQVY